MTVLTAHLSPGDRLFLAEALLLRRYVGHLAKRGQPPDTASEAHAYIALKLAKRLGVFSEYWQVMQQTDVLSVAVRNLDEEQEQTDQTRRKPRGPYQKKGGRPKGNAKYA